MSTTPVLTLSALYGGGRDPADLGQEYDDVKELGDQLDLEHPIISLGVWWGQVIDGITITYLLADGKEVVKTHGSTSGTGRRNDVIELLEISGVQGESLKEETYENLGWGHQVTRLSFTIFDSETGLTRVLTMGNGGLLDQETRQDILVRGSFAGLRGIANNQAPFVGLNEVQFYTVPPV